MINKYILKDFITDFEDLIRKEKINNKQIRGRITDIKDDIIDVSLYKSSKIAQNTTVEINKIQGIILKNNNKNLKIKLNNKSSFYKNQEIKINNLQNDIIILKLENLLTAIKDNKLNQQNIEVLEALLDDYNNRYDDKQCNVKSLNQRQQLALNSSISTRKFHIIKGPPGTGKTHSIVEIIKYLYSNNYRILITTHTHIAIDNILEKLGDLPEDKILRIGNRDKINPKLHHYHIDSKLKKHPSFPIIKDLELQNKLLREDQSKYERLSVDDDYVLVKKNNHQSLIRRIISKFYHLDNNEYSLRDIDTKLITSNIIEEISKNNDRIDEIKKIITMDVYQHAQIIASTVLSSSSALTKDMEFDYVIMDEASQVPTYLALIALLKTDKFILIGDDMQLQPITINHDSILTKSIFNHMIEKYPDDYTFLNIQYRMNPQISDISSKLYYNNRLKSHEKNVYKKLVLINDSHLLLDDSPVTLIDTSNVEYYQINTDGGCINEHEAELVMSIIDALIINEISCDEIGVITPYKKQKMYIKGLLEDKGLDIECDTIYRFQGREKDVILISFCKSSRRLLNDFQKKFLSQKNQLNVSITRARKKLIIIADRSLLDGATNMNTLFDSISLFDTIFLEDLFT